MMAGKTAVPDVLPTIHGLADVRGTGDVAVVDDRNTGDVVDLVVTGDVAGGNPIPSALRSRSATCCGCVSRSSSSPCKCAAALEDGPDGDTISLVTSIGVDDDVAVSLRGADDAR